MFCPNCRNQVLEGAEFCPNCGTNLKQIQEQLNNPIQQPIQTNTNQNVNLNITQQSNNNGNNKKFVIVPIIIVAVVVIIAIFGANKLMKKDTTPSNDNQVEENTNVNETTETQNNTGGNTTGTVDPNTNLTYDKDGAFLMAIEDVFTITGKGTIITGRIERGTINLNDEVQIIGLDHEIITTTVTGIEMFRKELDYAEAGDNVGILLKDVGREEVERGQVIAKPNSIKATTKFEANVYILAKEEGGRHTPFFNNYRPQFYFRTTDITGVITLPDEVEMVNPGEDNVKMYVELISNVAMEVGTEFSISEDGCIVGRGTVTKVY